VGGLAPPSKELTILKPSLCTCTEIAPCIRLALPVASLGVHASSARYAHRHAPHMHIACMSHLQVWLVI
jgi:hypothetical protein